jgi:hypothetical protein
MADNEMLVDVDIPIDIEGAYDPETGLHKTVPAERKKGPPPEIKVEDFEALKRDRDAERAARTKAEQDARAATDSAKVASGRLQETTVQAYGAHYAAVSGRLNEINTAIASTEAIANSAERELVDVEAALASAADDNERRMLAERKVKAQRELSRAESELVALHSGKGRQEAEVQTAKGYWEAAAAHADAAAKATPRTEPEQPKQLTPDEWIDTCPPATRPWLREHPEWRNDQKLYKKILRFADEYVDDHGASALDSKDFVAALDARFFPKEDDDVTEDPPAEAPRARNAPAAPVSRASTPNGTPAPSGGSKIRLTPDEQTTAIGLYPDMERGEALRKYATNKARAIRDGRYAPRG